MPRGSPETNFLFLGRPGFFVRDGDVFKELFLSVDAVPSLVLASYGTELSQGQKLVNFFISNLPSKLSLPSIYLVPFNQLREKRNGLPQAASNVCGPWRGAVQGAATLGGVLDTFQLPSFPDGFSVPDVRLLHLASRFRLGKEPHGMGHWAGRRRTCPFCCSAQVATSVSQTAV